MEMPHTREFKDDKSFIEIIEIIGRTMYREIIITFHYLYSSAIYHISR
jgi:hypothetical protein